MTETIETIDPQIFINSHDPLISAIAVELLSTRYFLSENWKEMHKIIVPDQITNLKDDVEQSVLHLKKTKVMKMLEENRKKILEAQTVGDDYTSLLTDNMRLDQLKVEISNNKLGIVVLW